MALRTTRQMIEVLAAGSGKGRVTKQGVSVLGAGTGGCESFARWSRRWSAT